MRLKSESLFMERTTVKETGGTGWVWILEIGRFPPNSVDLADKSAEIWLRNRFRRGGGFSRSLVSLTLGISHMNIFSIRNEQ
jgi:hypothetical protein